jgi:putative transposase
VVGSIWSVRDEVWEVFRRILRERARQGTGFPRVDDRVAFNAVVYVLMTGIAWQFLPREIGCSPATAHRRLQWQREGVWARGCIRSCSGV